MYAVKQNAGTEFAAYFENLAGEPAIPLGVTYRLRNATADVVLIDWTAVDAEIVTDENGITAVRVLIDVPGSANAIHDKGNSREQMELMVVSGKDDPREASEVFEYLVMRAKTRD